MSKNVVNLDAMRPHYRITGGDGKEHVLLVALVRDVAEGKQSPDHLGDAVLQAIVRDWNNANAV